jgi:hypothetical protein
MNTFTNQYRGQPAFGSIKPHLRLHYTPAGKAGNRSGSFPWSVEYLRGPSSRCRRETYQHNTAGGAVLSAGQLWF